MNLNLVEYKKRKNGELFTSFQKRWNVLVSRITSLFIINFLL